LVVEKDGVKHKVRLTSIGITGGMRLTMLFDPDIAVKRAATDLGLLSEKEPLNQLETLRAIIADEKRGVVVLAGLPDGGRTTTMYTIAAMHDAYTQSVQTVEFEPQLQLEGVRHQAFDAQAEGADFGTMVRSMLRRDPDVLAVAEVPDANTAKEIAKSDTERTRVYACVRSDNAVAAVEGYVRAVGDNALAAKGLRGAVAGRLLRRLCPNCKVEYAPAPDLVKKLTGGETKVERLFKKGGQVLIKNKPEVCPTCGGVGYLGQEGIFEVFPIDDEERELIATGNFPGLKAAFRKRGMPSIAQAAIRKALTGVTSVEEVQRATTGPAPAAQGAAAAPAKA
jgi:type II secretory ATPase GspE/PulE/Tfp pilus assembly ATPase PilB-like protein